MSQVAYAKKPPNVEQHGRDIADTLSNKRTVCHQAKT
jgi:hypothetical protein